MTLARTGATGQGGLDPQVLAFTSSLVPDLQLVREDLLGSLAHVVMLSKQGLIPRADGQALHRALVELWKTRPTLPAEEDVHMAVESHLGTLVGEAARRLHTARSRNDQVALDLKLHVREQCRLAVVNLTALAQTLAERAARERSTVLPAYTHRQRAQPVSLAYWFLSWTFGFLRDAEAFAFALGQANVSPLGVGAVSGTSLKNDRELTRSLLGFARATDNGLDTVADRDFALDYLHAASKCLVRVGRLGAEVVDYASAEFGVVKLGDAIACGSSMMPQKKNPDVFELLRGNSARQLGDLMGLFALMKGLPAGYFRDLQEDRGPILATSARLAGCLPILQLALRQITFDAERCRALVSDGSTQATDLAEALVAQGLPFRDAYARVGALVAQSRTLGVPLAQLTLQQAQAVVPQADEAWLRKLDPSAAAKAKLSAGSTGEAALDTQLSTVTTRIQMLNAAAAQVPSLDALFVRLSEATP